MTYLLRPYVDADAVALADLFNAADRHVGIEPSFTEAETRSFMTALVRDYATDTRTVRTAGGTLIANATVPTPPKGADSVRIFGAVHPDYLGLGLGRDLLAWQLERVAAIRRDREPAGSWDVRMRCDLRDTASARLYERFRFAPVRYHFGMRAAIDGAAAVALPVALRVATYRPEFLPDLHATHMEVFADHWGFVRRERAEWAALVVESGLLRADLSLIAYIGAEIVAYVLAADALDPSEVHISTVGTRRGWRGQGVATGLLSRVLQMAAGAGKRSASLHVDAENPTGALGVYERLGFTVTARDAAYSRSF